MNKKEIRMIEGIPHKKTLVPCPDGREGCLVAHYKWIELESEKEREKLFEEFIRASHSVRGLGGIVQNYSSQITKDEIGEWRGLVSKCIESLRQLEEDVVKYAGVEQKRER